MSTTETTPRLLTVDETAALLRCSRPTVYRRIAQGEIPAVRLGTDYGPLRVPANELEQWLFGVAGVHPPYARQTPAERAGPRPAAVEPAALAGRPPEAA